MPPPYFSTAVAPSHAPHPYMWGPQVNRILDVCCHEQLAEENFWCPSTSYIRIMSSVSCLLPHKATWFIYQLLKRKQNLEGAEVKRRNLVPSVSLGLTEIKWEGIRYGTGKNRTKEHNMELPHFKFYMKIPSHLLVWTWTCIKWDHIHWERRSLTNSEVLYVLIDLFCGICELLIEKSLQNIVLPWKDNICYSSDGTKPEQFQTWVMRKKKGY